MLSECLFQNLNELRLNGAFCDLELVSEDGRICKVHNCIFVSACKRQFALIKEGKSEAFLGKKRMVLPLQSSELMMLISFIYGEQVNDEGKLGTLYSGLSKLGMLNLLEKCGTKRIKSEQLDDNTNSVLITGTAYDSMNSVPKDIKPDIDVMSAKIQAESEFLNDNSDYMYTEIVNNDGDDNISSIQREHDYSKENKDNQEESISCICDSYVVNESKIDGTHHFLEESTPESRNIKAVSLIQMRKALTTLASKVKVQRRPLFRKKSIQKTNAQTKVPASLYIVKTNLNSQNETNTPPMHVINPSQTQEIDRSNDSTNINMINRHDSNYLMCETSEKVIVNDGAGGSIAMNKMYVDNVDTISSKAGESTDKSIIEKNPTLATLLSDKPTSGRIVSKPFFSTAVSSVTTCTSASCTHISTSVLKESICMLSGNEQNSNTLKLVSVYIEKPTHITAESACKHSHVSNEPTVLVSAESAGASPSTPLFREKQCHTQQTEETIPPISDESLVSTRRHLSEDGTLGKVKLFDRINKHEKKIVQTNNSSKKNKINSLGNVPNACVTAEITENVLRNCDKIYLHKSTETNNHAAEATSINVKKKISSDDLIKLDVTSIHSRKRNHSFPEPQKKLKKIEMRYANNINRRPLRSKQYSVNACKPVDYSKITGNKIVDVTDTFNSVVKNLQFSPLSTLTTNSPEMYHNSDRLNNQEETTLQPLNVLEAVKNQTIKTLKPQKKATHSSKQLKVHKKKEHSNAADPVHTLNESNISSDPGLKRNDSAVYPTSRYVLIAPKLN